MIGASGKEYKLSIVIEGTDKASAPLGNAGGALGNIAQIAAGILGADLFKRIADGIINMGRSAVAATADYQMMAVGIEALMARELARGQTTEILSSQAASLSAEEKLRIIDLSRTYDSLGLTLTTLEKQYADVANTQGANSEAALKLQIEIEKTNGNIKSTSAELQRLQDKADGATMAMEKITTGTMSIAEAMPQARIEAERLLKEIRALAIQSPYELGTVQTTLKLGMAFGFTADQAMAFTRGVLQSASGIGASNEMLDRMAYNLAQVRMQGKVTQMDIRQLAMAGFDLNGVLVDMAAKYGYQIKTHLEFNKLIDEGKLKWADFASSFEEYADKNFGGASERLSKTWNGMMSNFKDVFNLSMPSLMGPALEKVTVFLNGFMQKFIDFTNSGKLEEWGAKIGESVQVVLDWFSKIDEVSLKFERFGDLLQGGYDFWLALGMAFGSKLPGEIKAGLDTVEGYITQFMADAGIEFSTPIVFTSFEEFKTAINTFFEDLTTGKSLSGALKDAFNFEVPADVDSFMSSIKTFFADLKQGAEDARPSLQYALNDAWTFWKDNGPQMVSSLQDIADTNTGGFADTWSTVLSVLGDLAQKVMPFLTEQWAKIAAWANDNAPLIQNFLQVLNDAFQVSWDIFSVVLDVLGKVVEILWNTLQPILGGVIDILLGLGTMIMQFFTGDIVGSLVTFVEILRGILNTIWEAMKGFWNTILGWFGTSFADLHLKWTTWWGNLKLKVVEIWDGIKTAISEKFTQIKDNAKTWLDDMKTKIKNFIPDMVQVGKDLFQGMWDGLKAKYQEVMDWLSGAIADISARAKKILGIKSPSTVFADIGENIMAGLAKGITGGLEMPVNAIYAAGSGLTQAMPTTMNGGSSTVTNANQVVIQVSGSDDPDRVADAIMRKLKLQGIGA